VKVLRMMPGLLVSLVLLLPSSAFGANRNAITAPARGSANPDQAGLEMMYAPPIADFINTFPAIVIDPNTGGFTSFSDVPNDFACTGGAVTVNAQFLYVSLPPNCVSGGGQLAGYSLDPATGQTTPIPGSPFSSGKVISPAGLATAPNSYFLYLADAGQIDGFTLNSVTGVPAPIKGSPFPSGNNSQLTVDPSGKFL